MASAVVVVDLLNEFLRGRPEQLLVPAGEVLALVDNTRELLGAARQASIPVVYVACAHDSDDVIFRAVPPHALRGTWEAQIVPELAALPGEPVVEKKVYDGFHQTRLEDVLRDLDVDQVYLAGAQTDCCVHATGQGAIFRGIRAAIVPECVATATAERQRVGLDRFRDLIGPVVSRADLFVSP